jgi:hypothetical protein
MKDNTDEPKKALRKQTNEPYRFEAEIKAIRQYADELEAAFSKGTVKALDKTIGSRLQSNRRKPRSGVPAQW